MNKREQQKIERREKITQAAQELFLTRGIQQVQLQDVADAVGIGIATLYRYFPNKEQLLIAVNNVIIEEMLQSLTRISELPISAYEQVEQILDYYIGLVEHPAHQFVTFFKAFQNFTPDASTGETYETYTRIRYEMAQTLLRVAKKGQQDGSVRTNIDLDVYMMTIVHNISFFSTESVLTSHDPNLPVTLTASAQLRMLKDIFLTYIHV
ncbi:TetR/AcrR family transcriptional regulator [Caryophanon tenue]|uniref:Transcriptional regulator n=1 Tax=Caryophanon tenue TaxID=33978 RepID=A0A1C0YDY5_9BACL|nr:TetR/AcrR family transcriptional regulator [Caryophanon tenue]OCS85388.1 transcriptional regulator [Caryophanon tenue]